MKTQYILLIMLLSPFMAQSEDIKGYAKEAADYMNHVGAFIIQHHDYTEDINDSICRDTTSDICIKNKKAIDAFIKEAGILYQHIMSCNAYVHSTNDLKNTKSTLEKCPTFQKLIKTIGLENHVPGKQLFAIAPIVHPYMVNDIVCEYTNQYKSAPIDKRINDFENFCYTITDKTYTKPALIQAYFAQHPDQAEIAFELLKKQQTQLLKEEASKDNSAEQPTQAESLKKQE